MHFYNHSKKFAPLPAFLPSTSTVVLGDAGTSFCATMPLLAATRNTEDDDVVVFVAVINPARPRRLAYSLRWAGHPKPFALAES